MPEVNLLIPAAPKDYIKVKHVLRSVNECVPEITKAYVVSPGLFPIDSVGRISVTRLTDSDVLPNVDPKRFKYRPGWIMQQLIKLSQDVTEADWYWVLDADRIILKPINLFPGGKPLLLRGNEQPPHGPYLKFNEAFLGFSRAYPHSLLSEATLYSKSKVTEMLASRGVDRASFREWCIEHVNAVCYPADAEVYGNWIMRFYPDLYTVGKLLDSLGGKYYALYNDAEILERIQFCRNAGADIMTVHSWGDPSDLIKKDRP